MSSCLLYRASARTTPRFYRIELVMNLFDQVSLMREWGVPGGKGQSKINTFDNLRDASVAADRHRNRLLRRGYGRS